MKIIRRTKRLVDLAGSAAALVVLSPVMIVIAVGVATTSPGGVFFRGDRVGQNGSSFRILKFRSMRPDSEGAGAWNVSTSDPRVTPLGRFLRASKLDELPQLVNVLVGDMSLVGPRPEMRHYVDLYSPEDAKILEMKPGLTDWASILNFSQYQQFESASDPDSHYLEQIRPLKLHLQRYLLDTQSAVTDVRIVYWTVASFLARETRLPRDIQAVVNSFLSEVNQ